MHNLKSDLGGEQAHKLTVVQHPVRVRVDRRRLLLVHLLDGGGGRVDKLIWIG